MYHHIIRRVARRFLPLPAALIVALTGQAAPAQVPSALLPPANPDDPVERLSRYLRVLSGNPRDLGALSGAGRAALDVGDPSAAVGFFARAQEAAPRDGRVKAGLAAALVQLEQPREALRLFEQARDLGVPEAEFAADRGLAYDLRGEGRRAQDDYRRALSVRPDDAETTRRLALSMAMSGDRQGALAVLDPLLRRQDRAAWRASTFVMAMTGDTAGADARVGQLMVPAQAQAMRPFLDRLATLRPAEQAAAVHFGHFPNTGGTARAGQGTRLAAAAPRRQTAADRALVPTGTPLAVAPTAAAPGASASPGFTDMFADTRAAGARAARRRPGEVDAVIVPAAPTGGGAVGAPSAGARFASRVPAGAGRLAASGDALPRPATRDIAPAITAASRAGAIAQTGEPSAPAADLRASEAAAAVPAAASVPPSAPVAVDVMAPVRTAAAYGPPSPAPAEASVAAPVPAAAAARAPDLPSAAEAPASAARGPAIAPRSASPVPRAPAAVARPGVRPHFAADSAAASGGSARARDEAEELAAAAPAAATRRRAGQRVATVEPDDTVATPSAGTRRGAKPHAAAAEDDAAATGTARRRGKARAADDAAATAPARRGGKSRAADASEEAASDDRDAALTPKQAKAKAAVEAKAAAAKAAKTAAAAKEAKAKAAKDAEAKRLARQAPERYWVQVAGGANKKDLPKAWAQAKAQHAQELAGKSPHTTPLRFTNRLLVGPFKSEDEAQAFVNRTAKAGWTTFSFTSPAGQKVESVTAK